MIFDKRKVYKPFEYPEVNKFIDAINNSYWVHGEIKFTNDVQDYHTKLTDNERLIIKRTLLAISQIEINVKEFWGDLYKYLPKPEFNNLGASHAESEVRHSEAYSELINALGYNDEFKDLIEVPVIKKRIKYLSEALASVPNEGSKILQGLQQDLSQDYITRDEFDKASLLIKNKPLNFKKNYLIKLILFSILIENVSLFSQFAIMLSFTRHKGFLGNISNIIGWTSVDEQIHAFSGMYIVNEIRKEYPEMFDESFEQEIQHIVSKSINVESELLDWIFENGELEHVSKESLLNFMKNRVDVSLAAIGFNKMYNVSEELLEPMFWFEEEIVANTLDDFFAKRPTSYSNHDIPITHDQLFK
jgi:ribonucleoside-diphosphate reductase beta chain